MTQFKTFPLMLLIGLISLCSCDSCSDEIDTTVLPPETQSGENTFGCYVNDELFVHNGTRPGLMEKSIYAEYHRQSNFLYLHSYSSNAYFIGLNVLSPSLNSMKLKKAWLWPQEAPCTYFSCIDCGEIILTRFDTINKIVSGRFQFNGQCSDNIHVPTGDSIVYITEGRFDIRLEMYDN